MALTYDQVTGLTHALINESAADNIYTANPLFKHLLAKGKVVEDGGAHIQLPIVYATQGAVGSFSKYSLLDTNPTTDHTAAKWLWKYQYAQMIVSRSELAENSGRSQAVNLLKSKLKNAMLGLENYIGTQIFSTNSDSSQDINGLRQTVKATGQCGNIDQSDFSGWASDVDASTTSLTTATMEQAFLDASVGADSPDIIVTTKGVFKKYWDIQQALQRFGPAEAADAGFQYLLFNQVPIFWDSHCPGSGSGSADNHMFFLNSRWLYFYVHKDMNMVVEDVATPATQVVKIQRILFAANLVTDNRRMHSLMSTLQH